MAKILFAEDEVELAEPLGRLLEQEGYQVDLAHTGTTALEHWQTLISTGQGYDLVILDWMLPGPSGLEICRQLRRQGDQTPVLFLTARDTLDDRVAGLDAGGDDYLVKPFELRELLARIRALLRRHLPGQSSLSLIKVADLELDMDNRIAYRGDRPIPLSDKETALLAYLMEHPQQLLPHEDIQAHLWPDQPPPNRNVLAAQIRLLRRKIEQLEDVPLIHTVYGHGYRFGESLDSR
ncbi:response regulator transcription factor [Candidatus Synechococcus calcipolaris G9]|uniref:Response regulator transcription factor n=1 Tax=Candidatus Synechococcus calcipolaris G9 TaxID=1497997 RepID=A0ABT6F3C3_9SYNE|nr:response regulator transcription factor [Candidatus Synechococcus calcipolaris]MDG2992348.1 response regulator transcription factor [Candidatus Synechococcus calcipolaris G9]